MRYVTAFILLFAAFRLPAQNPKGIVRMDEEFYRVFTSGKFPEVISKGHTWTEGPLWIAGRLLFSDAPSNTVYQWTEAGGTSVYLRPSGFTGEKSASREPGSNGLLADLQGNLVLCQHGDRRMARMDAPVSHPESRFITLADRYKNKRFSSPNDAVMNSAGEIFFTDPPYGLPSQSDADPGKEIPFNGVYKIKTNGEVILLVDSLTRPNGIALFPDEKRILIANSDPAKPYWYLYDIDGDRLKNGRLFYTPAEKLPGGPDGLKIDRRGIVYSSGPGGIFIFNADGKLLGNLWLDEPVSNCALSEDQKTLYITNNTRVWRWKMRN